MSERPISDAVRGLVDCAASRVPLGAEEPPGAFVHSCTTPGEAHYSNDNARLGIEFRVERLSFAHLQTLDPRIVVIAPGKNNEYHRHAHESLFVVLEGHGEVLVGTQWTPVTKGDVAFVPRWIFHQSRNTSRTDELVILAVTDFGFTSAVLGDYDRRTRLAADGDDARATDPTPATSPGE